VCKRHRGVSEGSIGGEGKGGFKGRSVRESGKRVEGGSGKGERGLGY